MFHLVDGFKYYNTHKPPHSAIEKKPDTQSKVKSVGNLTCLFVVVVNKALYHSLVPNLLSVF